MASKPKSVERPIVLSGRHLTPAAKAVVLGHAMETAAAALGELAQLCVSLGEDALGREAQVIREAFMNRQKALRAFSHPPDKSLLLEKQNT